MLYFCFQNLINIANYMQRTNIIADGHIVEVRYQGASGDFFSLTGIARYRTMENPGYVIQNWMRNRNTIRFLGVWERLHNISFNCLEFEAIESQSGLNSFALTPMNSLNAAGDLPQLDALK